MARRLMPWDYEPWPQVRIEWPGGYAQISLDYLAHGPRRKVSKIMTLAKKIMGGNSSTTRLR